MVQKYESPVRVYKNPFELVMKAYEMRFPTCDMIPVVKETEIIAEEISEDGAIHMIDRRAKLSIDVPYLLKKIMGVDHLLFRQKNTLDKRARTLEIDAWNESFCNRVVIKELCIYSVHPENPEWTCFEQKADLDIKSFFGFEGSAEKVAINEYSKNIAKSKDIMEYYINLLSEQGVTHVPIWTPPEGSLKKPENDLEPTNESAVANGKEKALLRRKSSGIRGELEALHIEESSSSKLEQGYIQMYLGELTPMQESRLVQLKNRVSELLKGKVPSDPVFLRFLRARDFNVEKAREMLSQSLMWRKKHGVDKILSEYELPKVLKDFFPGGWHHYDKEGRPLFILRLGQMDVKGIIKSVGEEGITKLTLHICEEGLRLTEEAAHRLNKPISTWCLLLDLEGLNMRHLWRPGMKALLHIIEICEANYPETLGRVLIIRAPRVFPIMWTLVSPLIDETSREKFLFYGGNGYQESGGLVDYIPTENIPDWLGGPKVTDIPEGGLVPKSHYMPAEEFVKDQSPGPHFLEESYYHSTSLSRGQVHEGVIQIEERGTVITWDFDVLRHDVVFTVFRLKDKLPPIKSPGASFSPGQKDSNFTFPEQKENATNAGTGGGSGTATGVGNANVSGVKGTEMALDKVQDHKTCLDRTWRENVDYFKVENSIVCHDGESIQGSHVTSHPGTYVLQWKFFDKHHLGPSSVSPLDVIADSLSGTQHKAKIMYYYETLNSVDYRGSMTSLQSCQSGFSTISKISMGKQSSSGVSSAHSDKLHS